MNWDLSHLFNNYDEVDSLLKSTKERAQAFNKNNKTKLSSFSVEAFVEVFSEYETILEGVGQIMTFVFLEFATDASKGGTLAKYQKETTLIEEQLIFFELEFNTLDRALQDSFIAQAGRNAFYLHSLQKEAKFQLQEGEERILMKKDLTSSSAFSRLFDEHFSRLKFSFQGEMLSEEEILSKLYSSDRGVRKEAAYALGAVLEQNLDLTTYIYNMIKSDWAISAELRGYETALTPRNISNKIEQQSVESLIETATNNYHLVEKYYGLKAKILGIEKLEDWDRYAPISAGSSQVEFKEAKQMVLDTFEAFNPTFHAIALRAFDEQWIDVFPKEGKRGGAFSHGATTNVHPYVLLNYTNQRRDVFTLAHELGHTIHQYLAQDAGYLNQHTPLTTAETASVFAEMLLFDNMKESLPKEELVALYASKLEDIFATLFRQIVFTKFEQRVHAKSDELSKEELNSIWQEENQKMFGNAIVLSENYQTWWSYIPHFVHSPFYCYAYSYGELLVLALFNLYKSDYSDFKAKYEQFLALGDSKSPKELVGLFGLDIEDENFWKLGIEAIEAMLSEFETLVGEVYAV